MDILEKTLKERFHLPGFRPLQRDIIEGILEGKNVIAVLATGGGKSLCFQLPALLIGRLTLVITPLVALMEDQVKRVMELGIAGTYISSVLDEEEKRSRLRCLARGEYQILFIAPERLPSKSLNQALQYCPPYFIAIDEAHCISQWGHDFRPSYMEIGPFVQRYMIPYRAAFTGTATRETIEDMKRSLGWEKALVLKATFDRPNLKYMAYSFKNSLLKRNALKRILRGMRGAGAIYCSTRKDVEQIHTMLRMWGADPCMYHAGLSPYLRKKSQADWISGRKPLMVATNAFGMGIDKGDVRFVIHYQIPGNLENYYQEAGRAGRDRQDSFCILLYTAEDQEIQEFFLSGHTWDPLMLEDAFKEKRIPENLPEYVKRVLSETLYPDETDIHRLRQDLKKLKVYASLQMEKFEKMKGYVLENRCRRKAILDYFDEASSLKNCGGCDVCLSWSPDDLKTDYLVVKNDLRDEMDLARQLYSRFSTHRFYVDAFHFRHRSMIRCILNHGEQNGLVREMIPGLWMTAPAFKRERSKDMGDLTLKNFPGLIIRAKKVRKLVGQQRLETLVEMLPKWFLKGIGRKRYRKILETLVTEDEIRMLLFPLKESVIEDVLKVFELPEGCLPPRKKHLSQLLACHGMAPEDQDLYLK
ncbi:RecQ family ATP-dependent DNA helicase [Fidelibacter multiformis]|uniref:RecQ family ATP-dependent DNA helicase n=1 Tax=Fidelibacter multiformis TaxID=3377529 RepID=UPI0037DC90C1